LRKTLAKQGQGWKRLLASAEMVEVAKAHNYVDLDALYRAIGDGHIAAKTVAQQVINQLTDEESEDLGLPEQLEELPTPGARSSDAVIVQGVADVMVTLARCCTPVPRDEILGFVTRGRGISVHRVDCPNAEQLRAEPERLVEVRWNTQIPSTFRVTIEVE